MKKKVSYVDLLKEAISEFDVKSFDYKGPMTEPILGYTGDGEMETNKDAASILERYYYNEKNPVLEQTVEEPDPEEKNEIVTGDTPDDIDETMDDFEDEILNDETSIDEAFDISEDLDLLGEEAEVLGDQEEVEEPEEKEEKKEKKEEEDEGEEAAMESAILEKLIEEMEEETKHEDGPGVTDGDQGDVEAAKDEPLDVDKEMKKGVEESFQIGPLSKASGKSDRTAKEEIEEAFKIFKEELMMEEDVGETPAGNEQAGAAGKEKALGGELDDEDLGLQKESEDLEEDLDFLGEDFMLEEEDESEEKEEGKEEKEEDVDSEDVKA